MRAQLLHGFLSDRTRSAKVRDQAIAIWVGLNVLVIPAIEKSIRVPL